MDRHGKAGSVIFGELGFSAGESVHWKGDPARQGGFTMRRLILLGLAVAMALPAGAARHVTVARLEQTLAAAIVEHRTDAEVAREIGSLELSERLTDTSLNRLAAKFLSRPHIALAVQLLADKSAFLD